MNKNGRVILVTGASSGIGKRAASHLVASGYRVYGTCRKTTLDNPDFKTLMMDVDSDDSVNAGVETVIAEEGVIDVVVNCAGYGIAGAVEDTTIEEARAQFETNLFGVMRVCKAVLPRMRERKSGMIINVSSLGGLISAPFHGLYCASKFAVEGLTEALRMEVAQFGIKVALVEPGDFKTNFTAGRVLTKASAENPAYRAVFLKSLAQMQKAEESGPDPLRVAKLIKKIIETPEPDLRYQAAPGAQALAVALKRILPWPLFQRIIARNFGL